MEKLPSTLPKLVEYIAHRYWLPAFSDIFRVPPQPQPILKINAALFDDVTRWMAQHPAQRKLIIASPEFKAFEHMLDGSAPAAVTVNAAQKQEDTMQKYIANAALQRAFEVYSTTTAIPTKFLRQEFHAQANVQQKQAMEAVVEEYKALLRTLESPTPPSNERSGR
jgi:hypothetical protein